MDISELLQELYGRIPPLAESAVAGLDSIQLRQSPTHESNSIGWLIWHVSRVQDHHVSEILDVDQLWVTESWAEGFGLDPDPSNIGFGHSSEESASVWPASPEILIDYLHAVNSRAMGMLDGLDPADLDRIVDRKWDPPVSLGVRLVSIADDCLQHVGQANYLRGMNGW